MYLTLLVLRSLPHQSDWTSASTGLFGVKGAIHWGGEGLTEKGIVKHYGDVQIRNSQEMISCSVTHACKHAKMHLHTHTHWMLFYAKLPCCSLARAVFHTLADQY